MSYLVGIHDLAYSFQRLAGAGSSAYSGDWFGLGANLGAMAGKAMWYGRNQITALRKALSECGTKVLPTPTAIVDLGMVTISAVDLLNGFGPPDKGATFASGADKFQNVSLQLDAAVPDSRDWDGEAATAYAQQVGALQTLVQRMQELDNQMQALVANQGAEMQKAHTAIATTLFGLTLAQGIALSLYLIPVVGPEISCAWQIIAAFAAGVTTLAFEMLALANSLSVTDDVIELAGQYGEVAAAAVGSGTFDRIAVAGAQESMVGGFEVISDAMPAYPATPTVADLASVAGITVSPVQRMFPSSLSDTFLADDGNAAAGEPSPLASALPTVSQMPPISPLSAAISGSVPEQVRRPQQTNGSVSQHPSIRQDGEAADTEPAAAAHAWGPEGVHRAPLDSLSLAAEKSQARSEAPVGPIDAISAVKT